MVFNFNTRAHSFAIEPVIDSWRLFSVGYYCLVWSYTHRHTCVITLFVLLTLSLCVSFVFSFYGIDNITLYGRKATTHTACIIEFFFFVKFKHWVFEYWPDYTLLHHILFYIVQCTLYMLFDIYAILPFNHSSSHWLCCLCQYTTTCLMDVFAFRLTWYE